MAFRQFDLSPLSLLLFWMSTPHTILRFVNLEHLFKYVVGYNGHESCHLCLVWKIWDGVPTESGCMRLHKRDKAEYPGCHRPQFTTAASKKPEHRSRGALGLWRRSAPSVKEKSAGVGEAVVDLPLPGFCSLPCDEQSSFGLRRIQSFTWDCSSCKIESSDSRKTWNAVEVLWALATGDMQHSGSFRWSSTSIRVLLNTGTAGLDWQWRGNIA